MTARLALAVGIGLLVVSSTVLTATTYLGKRVDTDEVPIFAFQVLWVSLPFLVLALKPVKSVAAWAVGLIATLALWAAYFYSAAVSQRDHSGVNFGIAFLLLLSPFLILGLSVLAARLQARGVPGGREGGRH
jgi:hypothetical protein